MERHYWQLTDTNPNPNPSPNPNPDSVSDLAYCRGLVRSDGFDFHLCSLLLDSSITDSVTPLYAFHIELTNIVLNTTEPAASAVRLHWWRDVLNGKTESGTHPVARELLSFADRHSVDLSLLIPKVEGHLDEVLGCELPTTSEFDELSTSIRGCLFDIPSHLADYEPSDSLTFAIRHSSIACHILWVILNLRLFSSRGINFFPSEILTAASLTADDFFGIENNWDERHIAATTALLDYCESNLVRAETSLKSLNSDRVRLVFLPLSLCSLYIGRIRRGLHRPYAESPVPSRLMRQWRLWRASRHPKKIYG